MSLALFQVLCLIDFHLFFAPDYQTNYQVSLVALLRRLQVELDCPTDRVMLESMAHITRPRALATNKVCLTKGNVRRFLKSSCSGLKADLH